MVSVLDVGWCCFVLRLSIMCLMGNWLVVKLERFVILVRVGWVYLFIVVLVFKVCIRWF